MAVKVRVVRAASRLASTLQGVKGTSAPPPAPAKRPTPVIPSDQRFPVVVLVASTGGPPTVMRLAPRFTPDFPPPLFLLHHMPPALTTPYPPHLAQFTPPPAIKPQPNHPLHP